MNRNLDCKYLMVISEQQIFTAGNQYNFTNVTRKNFQYQYYPAPNSAHPINSGERKYYA